ncbi:hypothetical protein [Enterocloster sp.]|uniref:hypothetical protein n=1 Tax=Enterocloster sp. TaxID=2719315 RepID=UPI0039A360FD
MKQQMRDMLSTLGRAEAILDSRTKKRETEEIARLLEDMQASAMAIGTAIEQVEGDGTQTVRLLEDYCELLWQYMVEEDLKERFCKGRQLAGKRGKSVPAWRLSLKCGWKSFSLCAEAGPGSRWNVSTIS